MDRKYVMTSLGYAIVGMLLGIYMAASKNHSQLVAHAHILLVGSVISFMYALFYKLWLPNVQSKLVMPQFVLHQFGALTLTVGLFLLYGNHIAPEKIDSILSIGSIATVLAMVLMKTLFLKHSKKSAA